MRTQAGSTISGLTEPPAFVQTYKQAFLDFRRKYNCYIVGAIAAAAVVPAALAGPSKLDKARIAARNLLVIGGSSAVLLYPEFAVEIAAPAVARAAEKVQQKW